jgi:ABC-type dipeptide/oligopeptide/nickel transport system permease component/ABC-type transport system substrate-binding protein
VSDVTTTGKKSYRATPIYVYGVGMVLALLFVWGVFWAFGCLVRPDTDREQAPPDAAEVAEAMAARDVSFTPDDQYSLHVEVPAADYARAHLFLKRPAEERSPDRTAQAVDEGRLPAWFPRAESPILHDLVEQGKLPPVAERVGPEPVVMDGVDGIGKYGGTWLRLATSPGDVRVITWRLAGTTFTRFSPLGDPVVPHAMKRIDQLEEGRVYVLHFRRGMKWSDGHPFDAGDLMYWWKHNVNCASLGGVVPAMLRMGGDPATLTQIDDFTVRVEFTEPNSLFLKQVALDTNNIWEPEHYLRQFHPDLGDPDFIAAEMKKYTVGSPRSLYGEMKQLGNPHHPRLWPWIPVEFRTLPPYVFVRNPYYWAVDSEGNQLPYIDRVQFDIRDRKMLAVGAANGQVSMQARHLGFDQYTEFMSRRREAGTKVYLWYPLFRSDFAINPNLNRRVDPSDPDTKRKAELLSHKAFRQALSLAIDRQSIIRAYYHGITEPSQVEPGPESPFHAPQLGRAFIAYAPHQATSKLDQLWRELGGDPELRDTEGCRMFPDGSRMTFYLDVSPITGVGPAQFVIDDWRAAGIRTILRERQRSLFYVEKAANDFDFNVWNAASDYYPLLSPRYFVATSGESFYAGSWGRWFERGGLYGDPKAEVKSCTPVPAGHPMRDAMGLYEKAIRTASLDGQKTVFSALADIAAENLWTINISTPPPQPVVVSADMRNIPKLAVYGWKTASPANTGIETYYFQHAETSAGAAADMKIKLLNPTAMPTYGATLDQKTAGQTIAGIIRYSLLAVLVLFVIAVSVRHPFVAHRLMIMVPTLLLISICAFVLIQLPPGDFLTSRIIQLEEAGDDPEIVRQEIKVLREMFHFDEPVWQRYFRWMGVRWFASFEEVDKGLLQGNMGRSMETLKSVNAMVGDRLLLTMLISLGTILFTWVVALPIGIYSAVRQHSISDYAITIVGFLGMCIPPFLLALILMTIANVSGLFSAEYIVQPEWSWGKVLDLLKHIWVPVVVMGVGGTASMIRIMRANLLDELKKPYVTTARAKGVRPIRLLFKYPVRIALNPFISGIGGLFPQLVSGGTIVAMVLALPTVGPLMLSALFSQDMNLAGSLLMLLSLLGVAGTLVSDLLLLWVDPRIRMDGGKK